MDLFFKEYGADHEQTIVLLHGGGGAGWMWQPQIERLTDYHLLVPDLPEHGQSRAIQPFTFPDAAAQVAELIEAKAHGGTRTCRRIVAGRANGRADVEPVAGRDRSCRHQRRAGAIDSGHWPDAVDDATVLAVQRCGVVDSRQHEELTASPIDSSLNLQPIQKP